MTAAQPSVNTHVKIGGLDITIRPITPQDKDIEAAFVRELSAQTKYERFFEGIRELSPSMLKVMCNVDHVNSMAYVATIKVSGSEKEIGVCRYATATDAKAGESEMAVTIGDDYPYQDIAQVLLKTLIEHAKENHIKRLFSIELSTNFRMHTLAGHFAMTANIHPDDNTLVIYSLDLS